MADDSDSLDVQVKVEIADALAQMQRASDGLRKLAEEAKAIPTQLSAIANVAKSQMQTGLSAAAKSAVDAGEGLKRVTSAAHEGGVGLGFYAREIHALVDEFTSGRIRQGEGTLANVALTFLQSQRALIPYAAGVAALGISFAVLATRAYQAQAAVDGLRLDAAANQFQLSATAAAQLRDNIEKLANMSASDAEAIAKLFLEMGNVGATVAQMLAPSMKQLAAAMGGDVAKAAEEAAKRFADLGGAGLAYVNASRSMTQAEKDHFAQLVAGGQRAQAYAVLVDLMTRSLEALKHSTDAAAAAERDHMQAIQLAASAGYTLEEAERMVGRAADQTAQKLREEGSALNALHSQLLAASTAADTFREGLSAAMRVDSVARGIKETQAEIDRLSAALNVAPDRATGKIAELGRALDLERQKMKGLQSQLADPAQLDRGGLEQFEEAQRLRAAQSRSTQEEILRDEIAANRAKLKDASLTEKEKQQLTLETADKERQLFDAQSKAGTKAARDVLGASRQALQQEIQLVEEDARRKSKTADDDLSHRRSSVRGYLATVKGALNEEIAAVQSAYARELQLAGLTETQKAALRREEALTVAKVRDEIVAAERKAADESQKAWLSVGDAIGGKVTSEIDGLLRGTQNISQAFKNMAASAIEDLINMGVKLAAEAAAMEAFSLFTGGGFVGLGGVVSGLIPKFASGSWSVPQDQLAMIHQGEMIVPAAATPWAQSLMANAAAGGGRGGGGATATANFHIHSMDASTVASTLNWNRGAVMKAMRDAVRSGAHHGMR